MNNDLVLSEVYFFINADVYCNNLHFFDIFNSFQTAYHGRAQTALPYAMNSEFSRVLSGEMVSCCCILSVHLVVCGP